MSDVVRRATAHPIAASSAAGEFLDPIPRRGEGLTVTTQVCLGAQPQLLIQWEVDYRNWKDGFKLLGFRSTKGFCAEIHPADLSAHGEMFLEETANGERHELLPEGTYYYTFLLHREVFFGLRRLTSQPVRFSQEIPTAQIALRRLKDQLELTQIQQTYELVPDEAEIRQNETKIRLHQSRQQLAKQTQVKSEEDPIEAAVTREIEPIVRKALVRARTQVEIELQLATLRESLKLHPGWKKIKKERRDQILEQIARDMDGDEAVFKA